MPCAASAMCHPLPLTHFNTFSPQADLNLEPWPGAPPPWCVKWGYQDLFPGQAYPNFTQVTLRSAADPYAMAGQLSGCTFEIHSQAEADEASVATTGGGVNVPLLGAGIAAGVAAGGMWCAHASAKHSVRTGASACLCKVVCSRAAAAVFASLLYTRPRFPDVQALAPAP